MQSSAVKSSSHELMTAAMVAAVGGAAGNYLVGGIDVILFGAVMPAWAGIGAACAAGHIAGKVLAEKAAPALQLQNPMLKSNLPTLMTGLATYGVVRAGMSSGAKFVPVASLGAASSLAGERLHSSLMGGSGR
jgi:hypothetical protein